MDIIDVPLVAPTPRGHQQENWLLDPAYYWEKAGTLDVRELAKLVDAPGPLWVNGYSTYNGANDRVPVALAKNLTTSLKLVFVDAFIIRTFSPSKAFNAPKRKVQAQFSLASEDYGFWITDPSTAQTYLGRPDGTHQMGPAYLTVSLAEPHSDGYCYKVVAAVFTP